MSKEEKQQEFFIKTISETGLVESLEDTLDDVDVLEKGIQDNEPTCEVTNEEQNFEECDFEYGLEVFMYKTAANSYNNYRLQLPLFRGLFAIKGKGENAAGVPADPTSLSPMTCGYKVTNDYDIAGCGSELTFEADDPLRENDLVYQFFMPQQEDQDADGDGEIDEDEDGIENVPYIYQIGYGGTADIYPNISHPTGLNETTLDEALSQDSLDFNGLFDDKDPAFYKYNLPSSYNPSEIVNVLTTILNGPGEVSYSFPKFVSHSTYSFIMSEENIVINQPIVIGSVSPSDGGGIIIDLGSYFPIKIIAATTEPLDVTDEDIRNGEIPDSENLFVGYYVEDTNLSLRADHYSDVSDKRSCSKFLGGYQYDFNEQAVKSNIVKKIVGEQTGFDERYEGSDTRYTEFIGNGLNSNKIRLSSANIGDTIYLTGIVSSKNYHRYVAQIHTSIEDGAPAHFEVERTIPRVDIENDPLLDSNRQLIKGPLVPMPDGKYLSPAIRNRLETFIFNQFCHTVDDKSFLEWRLTEMICNGESIWRRWMHSALDDTPLLSEEGSYEPMFYSADSQGIKKLSVNFEGNFTSELLLPRSDIKNQEWFDVFLAETFREDLILENELDFEENTSFTNSVTSNMVFDVSDAVNNLLSDKEKLPYDRCFALAIESCPDVTAGADTGIGIPPLDIISNNIPETELDRRQLFCDELDSNLLEGSLFLLQVFFTVLGYNEESDIVFNLIQSIIHDIDFTTSVNDLTTSKFVAKATLNGISGVVANPTFSRNVILSKFTEEELEGFTQDMKGNEKFRSVLGPTGRKGDKVEIPPDGEPVALYDGADLPPGTYRIEYLSGAFQYRPGSGNGFAIHDPDSRCDGIYITFNSLAPCAQTDFLAPGLRESFSTLEEAQSANAGQSRRITHLGGPMYMKLVTNVDNDQEDETEVECGSSCPEYCIFPVSISPVITDQWLDNNFTLTKNRVVLPEIFEADGMTESARIFVETFGVSRQFDEPQNEGIEDYDYVHPQFNCQGLYPDHPIEYMSSSQQAYVQLKIGGNISIAPYSKKDRAFMVTPELNINSLSYHLIGAKKINAWTEKELTEIPPPDEFRGFSEGFTTNLFNYDNELEDLSDKLGNLNERIRNRYDQVLDITRFSYSRGKIINSESGAVYMNDRYQKEGRLAEKVTLVSEEEAYFTTDAEEINNPDLQRPTDETVNGWLKSVSVDVSEQDLSDSYLVAVPKMEFGNILREDGYHYVYDINLSDLKVNNSKVNIDINYGKVRYDGYVKADFEVERAKYINEETFNTFKTRGKNNSNAVDNRNRLFVFYEENSNISVAMCDSPDTDEERWFRFDGIIRLISGETATNPYVVTSENKSEFHIFFVLNGRYICHKRVIPSDFVIDDAFKKYIPLSSFGDSEPDDFGIEHFSEQGKNLRKSVINIILGGDKNTNISSCISYNTTPEDLIEQSQARKAAGLEPRLRVAYNCIGCLRDEEVSGIDFSAVLDRGGHLILFYSSEQGKFMNMVVSNNCGKDWLNAQRYVHMTHIPFLGQESGISVNCSIAPPCSDAEFINCGDDTIGTDCNPGGLSKFDTIYDWRKDIIYLIFIYNEGLYVRGIDGSNIRRTASIIPVADLESENGIQTIIRDHINLSPDSPNKPVFIAGRRPRFDLENQLYTLDKLPGPWTGAVSKIGPSGYLTETGILNVYYFDKNLKLWEVPLSPEVLDPIDDNTGPCTTAVTEGTNYFGDDISEGGGSECVSKYPWVSNDIDGDGLTITLNFVRTVEEGENEEFSRQCLFSIYSRSDIERIERNTNNSATSQSLPQRLLDAALSRIQQPLTYCEKYLKTSNTKALEREDSCGIKPGDEVEYKIKYNLTRAFLDELWPDRSEEEENISTEMIVFWQSLYLGDGDEDGPGGEPVGDLTITVSWAGVEEEIELVVSDGDGYSERDGDEFKLINNNPDAIKIVASLDGTFTAEVGLSTDLTED